MLLAPEPDPPSPHRSPLAAPRQGLDCQDWNLAEGKAQEEASTHGKQGLWASQSFSSPRPALFAYCRARTHSPHSLCSSSPGSSPLPSTWASAHQVQLHRGAPSAFVPAGATFYHKHPQDKQRTEFLSFLPVCVLRRFRVVSDSLRSHGLEPTSFLCPWDSPGKNTGVGCHALLQGFFPTQGSNLSLLRAGHGGEI